MRISIVTYTFDRLLYTKHCFKTLEEKAGYPYRHIIVDNGSTDGTYEWLKKKGYNEVIRNEKNLGMSAAFKQAVEKIGDTDILLKFDNDCEVDDDNIIAQIADFYKQNGMDYFVSPVIYGLNNPLTPRTRRGCGDYTLGELPMIGGIFAAMPFKYVKEYLTAVEKPGIDLYNSTYFLSKGCRVGYIMELSANHYETTNGQKERWGKDYHKDYIY
jgi:GT2 family glycosyltransferase